MRFGVAVILLAALGQAWSIPLPFQADDYLILPRVGEALGLEPRPAWVQVVGGRMENHYLFRPTTWVLWWCLIRLSDGLASPATFHVVAISLHAFTAWLLYRLLRTRMDAAAAAMGAGLFGILPGGAQAVSWISAQGDQLAVLFTIVLGLCIVRHRSTGSRASAWMAGISAALAFCSKDVALASFPLVALAWFHRDPTVERRKPWILLASVAVGVGVAVAARAWYLGTWRPQYLTDAQLRPGDLLAIPAILMRSLAYWNSADVFAGMAPGTAQLLRGLGSGDVVFGLRTVALVTALIPALVGLALRPRNFARSLLILVGWVCVLVPPLVVFVDTGDHSISRVFYPGMAAFAVWVAATSEGLVRSGRRLLIVAAFAPLAIYTVDMSVHLARTELLAGAGIQSRLESLRDVADESPPGTRFVVVDPEGDFGGIPTLQFTIQFATHAPFTRRPVDVRWTRDIGDVTDLDGFREDPRGMVVLSVQDRRFTRACPDLAPLPDQLPDLKPDPAAPGTYRFTTPVPARALGGLVARTQAVAAPVAIRFTIAGSGGETSVELRVAKLPADHRVALPLPEELRWLSDPAIDHVTVDPNVVAEVVAIRTLPLIEATYPTGRARVTQGVLPPLVFRAPSAAPAYRATVEFDLGIASRPRFALEVPLARLDTRADGSLVLLGDRATSATLLRNGGLAGIEQVLASAADRLQWTGTHSFAVTWRVEGIDVETGVAISRSRWQDFTVVRAEPPP